MSEYYVRAGQAITMDQWVKAYTDNRVDRTQVGDASVSTIYLGLNHAWGSGPPLIFETLVFGGNLDGEMERYSTEAEAIAGHADMVRRVAEDSNPYSIPAKREATS